MRIPAVVALCFVFCCTLLATGQARAGDPTWGAVPIKGGGRELLAGSATGGSGPRLVAYYDAGLSQRTACLADSDTFFVYIVAENFTQPVDTLRYTVSAAWVVGGPLLTYLGETVEAGTPTGDAFNGIVLDFDPPVDASNQLLLQTVRFASGEGCTSGCESDESDLPASISFDRHVGYPEQYPTAVLGGGERVSLVSHKSPFCDSDGMPELEIVSFSAPDTAMLYEDISAATSLVVRNSGPDESNYYSVVCYLCRDTVATLNREITRVNLGGLAAGATTTVPLANMRIPLDGELGRRYLLAWIDRHVSCDEIDETNNKVFLPITVIPDPTIDTTYVYAEDFQDGAGGWESVDLTDTGSHWTRTDYSDRSVLWCGTGDPSYATPPGYGNNWDESIEKQFTLGVAPVSLGCMVQYDTEEDYDQISVQVSSDGEAWSTLDLLDGSSGGFVQLDYDLSAWASSTVWIRFHFSSDGAWSDEDGYYNSDGALRIDWVSVTGHPTDDFDAGFDGWEAGNAEGAGGEFYVAYDPPCAPGEYPCDLNATTGEPQIVCNALVGFDPATEAIPVGAGGAQVNFAAVSPAFPAPQDAIAAMLQFDVYAELPYGGNIFYTYHVAFDPDWSWENEGYIYYGTGGWATISKSMSVPPGATQMKVRLSIVEQQTNPPTEPRPIAPYFDNVRVFGVNTTTAEIDISSFPRDCAVSDDDWDGVGDVVDLCPLEDAAPFDRDGDGCVDDGAGSRHVEYQADGTLAFWIDQEGSPTIGDGSDIAEVRDGVLAWNEVGGIDLDIVYQGTIDQPDARALDGLNTITFTDPDYVFPVGVLAVGLSTSFVGPDRFEHRPVRPGQIVDADIIFNPLMQFRTPTAGAGTDIRSVSTHEAGHLLGLSHSAVQTSTMFYVLPPGTEAATLELEDRLALMKAYADQTTRETASRLRGTVTDGRTGQPVPGAIVFAIESAGGDTLASEYTMAGGGFEIMGLPDGEYYVAIYPLNGSSVIRYLRPANVNDYVREHVVDVFVPEYWDAAESNGDDETAKTAVSVQAGAEAIVNIVTNIDEEGPVVLETSPAAGAAGVQIDASVLVSFSEPIDIATLQGNFSVRDTLADRAVGGNAALLDDDSTLAFIPSDNLSFETVYRLRLETGLSDKFGNGLSEPFTAYFTTQVKPDVGIESLAPRKGPAGSIVVIGGFGFEPDPAQNAVDFNGVPAAVTEASSTRLVALVPDGAVTGNVTVTNLVEGKTSNALSFTVLPKEEVARGYDAGGCQLGHLPRALAVSPDGALVFVATSGGYAAVVADPGSQDYLAVRHFDIEEGTDGIDVTPDGKRVYAVSAGGERLYRINGEPGAGGLDDLVVLSEMAVGTGPTGVLADPSGRRAFVAAADNTVQIWDTDPSSATFDRQIGVINSAGVSLRGSMAIDPTGSDLLVLSGEGRLCVCDIRGDTLKASIRVGPDPRDVAVDPAGKRAYVTDENGSVTVVSLEILQKVIDLSAGGALRGCSVTPAGSFLFAANRELDICDIVDLRAESRSFRSVVANIPLPDNPIDLEISPDGTYSFAICEEERLLAVTAIGIGPVLRTVSPSAGPVGSTAVLAGSDFGAYEDLSVSFGGTSAIPAFRRDSVLVVEVPGGALTGSVTVTGTSPYSPEAVSNEVRFEVLAPASSGYLRQAAVVPVGGLSGEVCAAACGGEFIALAIDEGAYRELGVFDTDPSSDAYLTLLGSAPLPAGLSIDAVLPLPAGDLAVVMDRGAGADGEPGQLPVIEVNRRSAGFLGTAGCIDVSGMTGGVSGGCIDPAGEHLVLVENGGAGASTVHLLRFETPGSAAAVPIASVPVAGAPIENPRFHPSGRHCYLPVADQAAPAVLVLDTDPRSQTFLAVVGSAALPAGPVPAAIDINHDGSRCYVLTVDGVGTMRRDLVVIDTADPASPAPLSAGPLGGSAPGASSLDVSPRGDRAVVSIEGEGLFHLDIGAMPDTFTVIGVAGAGGPYAAAVAYGPDASQLFCATPSAGLMSVLDFSAVSALAAVSGGGQSGVAGTVLPAPLRVKATTAGGIGAPGVPVTFTVTSGGGNFPANGSACVTVATDQNGVASALWQLGPEIGSQTVEVSSHGLSGSPLALGATALVDPETLPLQLVDVVPSDAAGGVSLSSSARLVFSRPVDPSTATSSTCRVREQGTSTIVEALLGFSDGNRRVSITPKEPLEALTAYDIEVTGGVRDAAGGELENPSVSAFTTTVPPPLRLDAVQPPSGLRGTNVVLSGQGFDRDPEDNIVLFNGEPAAVTEASNDHLVAVVPYDAAAGNITVQAQVLGSGSNMLVFRVLVSDIQAMDEDVIQKVGTGSTTRSVVVTPDGAMMYAVSPVSNSVIVVDIGEFAPVASIPVGENPFSIDIDPEGAFAFVTNFLSNDISVIDIAEGSPGRNTVVSTIDVGLNPIDALVTPDGDRLIVSNMGSMDLSIVDTDPLSETYHMVLASVGTGSTTRAVTITPDGGLIYVGTSDGYLVVDVLEYSVVKTVSTGSTTKSVTVTPDGALLVLLTTEGEVLLIDIAEGSPSEDQVVGKVTTGSTTKSVTVTPDGGLLYLVLENIDAIITVSLERTLSAEVYDSPDHAGPYPVTATVRDTIRAGKDPQQVAFAPNGAPIAVITNAGDNSVSIFNPEGVVIAVAISQFTARLSGERAMIEWRTHVEDNTEGFHVLRSEHPSLGYERITSMPVPAAGVPSTYRYEDGDVHPGRTYYYKIESVSVTGRSEQFGPIEFVYRARFAVQQNVPNPFNPVTRIRFTIPDATRVRLTVYDVAGRRIRTLVDRMLPADNYEVAWDGTNHEGRTVASGIYFYRLEAGKHSQTRKMVLLR